MDRRHFLRTTGGAAATVAASVTGARAASAPAIIAAPAVVSGTKDIRVAFGWPDGGQGMADSARRLAQRIEIATGQRYRFQFLASDKSGIAAVSSGEADAYHASEHDNLEASRAFAYFAGLPGYNGMRASALEAWMIAGGGQMLWDDLSRDYGVKALLAGHTGRSIGLQGTAPVSSLAAIAGRKIWAMGLARDVVRGIGAEPVAMPGGKLAEGLASGEVVAGEAGGAVASLALGLLAKAPHSLGAAINRSGTALSLGFATGVWDAMSAGDQAIIAAICSAELHTSIAEEKAHREQLLAKFRVVTADKAAPKDLASAISRVSDAVVAHLATTDAATQRINASYLAFRRAIGLRNVALSA